MKTLLIIDAGLGQARAYMAKTLLGTAAHKAHLELTDNPNDAELAIVLGTTLPADSALSGKQVFLGDINRAVAHPELFLSEAKSHATPYAAPAAATLPAAPVAQNASWRSPLALPALRIPLWRRKPLKPKPKNAAGG
jgi:PTS system fructose-specific IIC component